MNEVLTRIGIAPEQAERYAPVLSGAVVCLIGLIVLRLAGKGAYRGVAAIRRWYNTPTPPPEPGSDKWLAGEIVRLVTDPNKWVWAPTGRQNEFAATLPDGARLTLFHYGDRNVDAEITHVTDEGRVTRTHTFHDRKVGRAVRTLRDHIAAAKQAAEDAKFRDLFTQIVEARDARWVLTLYHADGTTASRTAPTDVNPDVRAALGWAYQAVLGKERHGVFRGELSRRVPGAGDPVVTALWTNDPRHACWVLDDNAGNLDYPGLAGTGVVWKVGSPSGFVGASLREVLAAARKANDAPITIPLPVEIAATGSPVVVVGHVRV